jgi:hypothetical protein
MKQCFTAVGLAALLAAAAACSSGNTAPTSPSSAVPGSGNAAPDGSTLKVTSPTLQFPTGGGRIETTEPVFVFDASQGKFVTGAFEYRVEVSTPGGTAVHTSLKLAGGADRMSYEIPVDLALDTAYRWRVRAESGTNYGPWSGYGEFRTIDYRGLVPRPADGRWPSNGPAVVNYVAASFPEYLRTTDLATRIHNMEFLRDRIIETGICGGMDLALNLKRGVGPHSHDAIAWRDGNRVRVIDIASAFDNPRIHLFLHWAEVAGPAGYDPYPNHPGC